MKVVIKTVAIFALIVLPLIGIGCNTIEGMGKDTQAAGQGVSNAAASDKPTTNP